MTHKKFELNHWFELRNVSRALIDGLMCLVPTSRDVFALVILNVNMRPRTQLTTIHHSTHPIFSIENTKWSISGELLISLYTCILNKHQRITFANERERLCSHGHWGRSNNFRQWPNRRQSKFVSCDGKSVHGAEITPISSGFREDKHVVYISICLLSFLDNSCSLWIIFRKIRFSEILRE